MYLSIVIPSYKGASTLANQLPGLIEYVKSLGKEYEIIVVDDGSGDRGETEKVAAALGCVFYGFEANKGKGAAVKKGMLAARGRFRIFTDADIPFHYEALPKMIHYLDDKEFHMVVGDRTLAESTYFGEIPGKRKLASSLFSTVVGRFITTGMFDTQCGLKGFRAETANDIFSVNRISSFAFDVEVIYIAMKRNYDIKRIPVLLRNQEGSTVSLLRHSLGMVTDLLRIKWFHLRGLYDQKAG